MPHSPRSLSRWILASQHSTPEARQPAPIPDHSTREENHSLRFLPHWLPEASYNGSESNHSHRIANDQIREGNDVLRGSNEARSGLNVGDLRADGAETGSHQRRTFANVATAETNGRLSGAGHARKIPDERRFGLDAGRLRANGAETLPRFRWPRANRRRRSSRKSMLSGPIPDLRAGYVPRRAASGGPGRGRRAPAHIPEADRRRGA